MASTVGFNSIYANKYDNENFLPAYRITDEEEDDRRCENFLVLILSTPEHDDQASSDLRLHITLSVSQFKDLAH